jgi:hypothetical protein
MPVNSVSRSDGSDALCLDDPDSPSEPAPVPLPGSSPESSVPSQRLSSKFGPAATWQNLPVAASSTPAFEGCSVNQDCADLDGRPVAQGQRANQPEAEFSVTARRFAPFYTFGGGFEGDAKSRHISRANEGTGGFTSDPSATSRTSLSVNVDGLLSDAAALADPSHNVHFQRTLRAQVHVTNTSEAASAVDGEIDATSAGANPLVPGAPDIDTDIQLTYELQPGALELQGTVWGDRFPNAELIASDRNGAALVLGEFQTEGHAVSGVLQLIGDAPRIPEFELMTLHAEIPLDSSNNFAGSPVVRSE